MSCNSSLSFRLLLLAGLILWAGHAAAENFPLPDSLRPNVEFWKRVYSEIDGKQGFMHDDRHLSIVYETISLPTNASRKERQRVIDQARQQIRSRLKRIATQSYASLSAEEKAIHDLFPKQSSSRDFRSAMQHIRFQLGQADKFRQAIRRSGYYTQYILDRLRQADLPLELAALPFVESSFNIVAHSHVGAAGIWQFMPATGRRFMEVSHVIDERYDPYRATDAAVRLLQYNYSILNSWPLALTAYNHGVGGMRRAVKKTGTRDIGVIVQKYRSRTFGFASRNFYAEFLAALEVSQNRQKYFPGIKPYASESLVRFELDHFIPAKTLASAIGVKLDKLKQHNLALREPIWDGEKHVPARYELRLPAHLITGHIDKQLHRVPLAERFTEQVPDKTYRVRRGDSLSRIAALYRVSVNDLVMMNNLQSRHRIRVGQTLFLPQKGQAVASPVVVASAAVETRAVPAEPLVTMAAVPETVPEEPQVTMVVAPVQPEIAEASPAVVADEPLVEDELSDSVQQIEATDPAEYSVADDNTIEIQAAETLGHYADWLSVKTSKLRLINRMSYGSPLVIGRSLKLDFSRVSPQEFEGKRLSYHKQLEDSFFADHRIGGTRQYQIRQGDSLWVIANREKDAPLWLIRQYNPDVDFSSLKPGDRITLPVIERKG